MPIRLNQPIKLTWDELYALSEILHHYQASVSVLDSELMVYRYQLSRQLVRRLDIKSRNMVEVLQQRCQITFTLSEIVLCREIIRSLEYSHKWQRLLALFDQAQVNLLPLHPT